MMNGYREYRRATTLFWVVLALALPAASGAIETIENDIYEVHVQAQINDSSQFGSWNAVTGVNHPAGPGQDLLFRDQRTTTNFSSLRIFRSTSSFADFTPAGLGGAMNLDLHLEREEPSPLADPGRPAVGWRTVWKIDAEGLRIIQDVLVVGTDQEDSAIYHTVAIENFGTDPVQIGWRNLHDWSLTDMVAGSIDGPANGLESACGTRFFAPTRDEFSHRPVAAGWVRVSLPGQGIGYEPLLSLGFDPGFLPNLPITVPDEYAYVAWGTAFTTAFDYSPQGTTDLPDSAGLSWFGRSAAQARRIAAGETARFTQALFAFPTSECPTVPPCAPVPSGLVGWWPFNEPDQGVSGRFDDVARGHDGIARFAPTAIDGQVGRAARFDGDLDQIFVGDTPDLDLPAGTDLSIDFWIRIEDTSGVSVVLEKRTSEPAVLGYQVFLLNGRIGLQLAEGSGSNTCSSNPATSACTNYVSDAFVADGEWHLVAVTVDRDDPQGGRWYLDGDEVGPRFHPTLRDGSLANDAPLRIGAGDPDAPSAAAPFDGDLDELEIARRVLTSGEINGIYRAGASGKCSLSVDAPWDLALCQGRNSVLPQISVCNESGDVGRYVFSFEGLPPMPAGVPHGNLCETAGPTRFIVLGDEPLVVPPGECRTAKVRIPNPPAQTSSQASCYQVTATDVVSGLSRSDFGFIPVTNRICCRPHVPVTPIQPGPGASGSVLFELVDTGLGSSTLDVRVEAFPNDEAAPAALRLADAAPGEAISRRVSFGPDGVAELAVPVELTEDFAPQTFYDVVLSAELDGDPAPELLASATVLPAPEPCIEGLNGLCLNRDRFLVTARWRTAQGDEGVSQAVPLTSDTGFFWFFADTNLELVVKVLDACTFNDRFWVFAGGLTNVEVELTVTDLLTGESKSYFNPLNTQFQPIQDINAFATCDAGDGPALAGTTAAALGRAPATAAAEAGFGPNAVGSLSAAQVTELPLNDERFVVEVEWATNMGTSGQGQGVPITTDTGYFWFFSDTNVELVIKVLDACSFNDRFWVFAGGLTNVEVRLTVTDTMSGESKTYVNPQETQFQPIQDTNAFATCP